METLEEQIIPEDTGLTEPVFTDEPLEEEAAQKKPFRLRPEHIMGILAAAAAVLAALMLILCLPYMKAVDTPETLPPQTGR